MSALTRIRNNQVYNSDIDAATKIKPLSIVGGLWRDPLIYTGSLTVGNLTVNGNATNLDTINIVSADPTIVLNRNFSGTSNYDVGLIMGRGNQTNTAFVWDEANKEFAFFYTSADTGTSVRGTVTNTGYANIHSYGAIFEEISANTAIITNAIISNANISGGTIDNTQIGNVSPNTGAFTTLTANVINAYGDGNTSGIINGTQIRANAEVIGQSLNGFVFNPGLTTGIIQRAGEDTNVSIINDNVETAKFSSNLTSIFTPLTVDGNITSTGDISTPTGNVLANDFLFANGLSMTKVWYTNSNVQAYLPVNTVDVQATNFYAINSGQVVGYITGAIGANVANSGVFTNVTINDLTDAIDSNTGALRVLGGVGIGANLHVHGNVIIESNLYVRGPTTTLGSQDLTVSDSIVNLHTFANLAPLIVNDGRDIGLVFHYYEGIDNHAFLGRANHTGWLEWYDTGIETSGNTFVGETYGTFKAGEIELANANASTSTTTGTLRVGGGAGIQGNVFAGAIQDTPIGNGIASTGNFTTLASTVETNLSNVNVTGNTLPSVDDFYNLGSPDKAFKALYLKNLTVGSTQGSGTPSVSIGRINLTDEDRVLTVRNFEGNLSEIHGSAINNTVIGNTGPAAGTFTNLTSTVRIDGNLYGSFNGNIGGITPNTAAFTTVEASGQVAITNTTISSSSVTGALTVSGGVGIAGNVNIAGNLTVDQNLLVVNSQTNQVGIKQDYNNFAQGASFQINATDSFLLPVGTTGERPTLGQLRKGMFRYNSSIDNIEYWNGTEWIIDSNLFTVISSDSFVGDGFTNDFTLSQPCTTASIFVSINGIVQIPSSSYTVSGYLLHFTEAPLATDIIDARTITTTVSVGYISDGDTSVVVSNSEPSFSAIVAGIVKIHSTDTSTYFNGGISNFAGNISLIQDTETTVDQFSKETFRSAKYVVSVSDFNNNKFQVSDVLVTHNGTIVSTHMIGNNSTSGSNFFTCNSSIIGSNVLFKVNSTSVDSYCNVQQIYIPV